MGRIIVASGAEKKRRDFRIALEYEGHAVTEAADAPQAIEEIHSGSHDVLILDWNIDGDLYTVCRAIRPRSALGIIALVREGAEHCRIDALNAGADDYLPERFVFAELLARVRAILRRVRPGVEIQSRILLTDRAIDLRTHKIHGPANRVTHLTPKEFLVLKCLIAHADQPVTYGALARTVWHRDGSGDLEYVRVVVGQLRRKLELDHNSPRHILTERSVGYRLTIPSPKSRQTVHRYSGPACQSDNQATAL
jgi:two-component system, OmpR family, KDP operon response regulator KdpE